MDSNQREFEEMVALSPDLERLVPPIARSLPWVRLFTHRALSKSTYEKIEKQLIAQGLTKTSKQYREEWQNLFKKEFTDHQKIVEDSVTEQDIKKIVDWFIALDSSYPELVHAQIEYWKSGPGNLYHSNGEFKFDVRMMDFWNISRNYYLKAELPLLVMLVPDFLTTRVKHGIAQYYLNEALRDAKNER